jgi:hypothetical protein
MKNRKIRSKRSRRSKRSKRSKRKRSKRRSRSKRRKRSRKRSKTRKRREKIRKEKMHNTTQDNARQYKYMLWKLTIHSIYLPLGQWFLCSCLVMYPR